MESPTVGAVLTLSREMNLEKNLRAGDFSVLSPVIGKISISNDDLSSTDLLYAESVHKQCDGCISSNCPIGVRGLPTVLDVKTTLATGRLSWAAMACLPYHVHTTTEWLMPFVGDEFIDQELDNYKPMTENRKDFQIVNDYAAKLCRNTTRGLLISGPVGTGKTHLSNGLIKTAMRRGLSVAAINIPDLLKRTRAEISITGTFTPLIERIRDKFLLALDDMGAQRDTDWAVEELYGLINHRYSNHLPTIFTTNMGAKEMGQQMDARTLDRIKGMTFHVALSGPSYRTIKRDREGI